MEAETVKRVCREAVPLRARVEGVGTVHIAGAGTGLAPQRVIRGALQTRAPLAAGVNADLSNDIEDRRATSEHYGVVAVEPARAICLVRLGEDHPVRARLRKDEDITRGDGTGEIDRETGGRCAVEIHLDVVGTGCEVDRRAGPVVDLKRFVVACALDVLGEEEIARGTSMHRTRRQRQDDRRERGERNEEPATHPHPPDASGSLLRVAHSDATRVSRE